jgi:DnaJ-domain-containing protein 1
VTILKDLVAGNPYAPPRREDPTAEPPLPGVSAELAADFLGLGVGARSTPAEIHSAYRRLAKRYHPDLVPESARPAAEREMKALNRAYDRLRKPSP